jgi:hypothetical protein
MNTQQLEQDISIIKEMIDKTRRKAADSGHMFVYMGLVSALLTIVIGVLEIFHLGQYVLPTSIAMAVINAFIGYRIAAKSTNGDVNSYPKTLFWHIWMACGFAAVMIVFLFPFLNLYSYKAASVLVCLVMGIAVFISGSIFELKFVQWCGLIWWIGAFLLAITQGPLSIGVMVAIIVFGWIVPGSHLNKHYKSGV